MGIDQSKHLNVSGMNETASNDNSRQASQDHLPSGHTPSNLGASQNFFERKSTIRAATNTTQQN